VTAPAPDFCMHWMFGPTPVIAPSQIRRELDTEADTVPVGLANLIQHLAPPTSVTAEVYSNLQNSIIVVAVSVDTFTRGATAVEAEVDTITHCLIVVIEALPIQELVPEVVMLQSLIVKLLNEVIH